MGALNDYSENKLLDYFLRGQAFTPPSSVYLGLFTAAPSDAGGGTEATGGAYARVSIPCSSTDWAATQGSGTTGASTGTSGTTSNNNLLTFPTPTAAWGTITAFAVFDAATGGNMLFYGNLTASQVVNTGNTVSFAPGALQFQIDN